MRSMQNEKFKGVITTNENEENDFTKSIGFGYDRSEIDPDDCELLNLIIAGYLTDAIHAKREIQRSNHD